MLREHRSVHISFHNSGLFSFRKIMVIELLDEGISYFEKSIHFFRHIVIVPIDVLLTVHVGFLAL